MPGGRPRSEVWDLFSDKDDGGSVACKRCRVVITNPKCSKLECHSTKCRGRTLVEKNKRKRVMLERAEEAAEKKRREYGAVNLPQSAADEPGQ